MPNKLTQYMLIASLVAAPAVLRADDAATTNPMAHPETAYHEHEAKEAAKDTAQFGQEKKEAKVTMEAAKKDYEESLKKNGAQSDVTKAALKRYEDARKDVRKFTKKTNESAHEMIENQQKAAQDKATQ